MSKRIYTQEQIQQLNTNIYVQSCTKKSITYTVNFKILALQQYGEGYSLREIFEQGGFDIQMIGVNTPKECLGRWRHIVKKKGLGGLVESRGKKGGRLRTKHLSDVQKIQYLEAQVAYLKEENDFLAKLRAKRKAE